MTRRRAVRWTIFAGVPVLAIILLIVFWNWDWFIPIVESRASAAAGRKVSLTHLHVELGRTTTVVADGVRVENPEGFPADPPLAQADHLTIVADVMAYIRNRDIVLPRIDLDHPLVAALATADGKNNYTFPSSGSSSSASSGPQIGRLTIENGSVHFLDPKLKADVQMAVVTQPASGAMAQQGQTDQLSVNAKGTYSSQPIVGTLTSGALLSLRDTSHPYPLDLHLANGATKVSLVGTIQDPLAFKGADLKLDLAGDDMADLFPLTGIPIPKTPKYHIAGQLDYADKRVRFQNFTGVVGGSDLEGTITEDPGKERPDVTMDLRSRRVNLADLGGFVQTTPGSKREANLTAGQRQQLAQAEASSTLLPTKPFNLPEIKAADIHLKYLGQHIENPQVPLDNLSVVLDIVNGAINLHPISFGVGVGKISGDIALTPEANREILAKADVKFDRVDVGRLMASTHAFQGGGYVAGRATLVANGNSIATWLGNGNGGLALYMVGGNLSALLVDLSGLEFGKAVLSALGIPQRTDVRCFIADFDLKNGLLGTRALLVDTGEALISGTGTVNLKDQRIDYKIQTKSKHFSVGDLPTPIDIGGNLKSPSIAPEAKDLAVRGGLAVALGFVAPPLALLPTVQFGTGDTQQCAGLVQQTRSEVQSGHPGEPARRPAVRRR